MNSRIVRRLQRVYLPKLYARSRALVGNTVQGRVVFIHLPKCGGTSVHNAIRESFGWQTERFFSLNATASMRGAELLSEERYAFRERLLLYYLAQPKYRYISGHFHYSEKAMEAFHGKVHFITLLRDPVARWFSLYFYNKYREQSLLRITEPLEAFIETDRAKAMGRSYVLSMTNGVSLAEAEHDAVVGQAIANLTRFSLLGVTEELERFQHMYQEKFGVKLRIGHKNQSPRSKAKQREEMNDHVIERVRALCEPNYRVYNAVLDGLSVTRSQTLLV